MDKPSSLFALTKAKRLFRDKCSSLFVDNIREKEKSLNVDESAELSSIWMNAVRQAAAFVNGLSEKCGCQNIFFCSELL